MKSEGKFKLFLATLAVLLSPLHSRCQGLFMNEVSNGPSGAKEYVEMVVTGTPCGTLDLRGWIVDDNNGDFACGPTTGVGIAQGHIRFANVATWSAVPVGSIILIYNDADLNVLVPASDPTDSNVDSVYIVPVSSTLLERTSGGTGTCPPPVGAQLPIGCSAACPATGSSAYSPVSYAAGGGNSPISLANAGDASQTRDPSGAYFHGISWGTAVGVTGGPDNLKISATSGTGRNYYFSGTDFRAVANWTMGTDDGVAGGDETPGAPNNSLNDAFIDALRCPTSLPIEATNFMAWATPEEVKVTWETVSEINSSYFEIQRKTENQPDFAAIGKVEAAGNSSEVIPYQFRDAAPQEGKALYRFKAVDLDGQYKYSHSVMVEFSRTQLVDVFPVPANEKVTFRSRAEEAWKLLLYSPAGNLLSTHEVTANQLDLSTEELAGGVYLYQIVSESGRLSFGKFTVSH